MAKTADMALTQTSNMHRKILAVVKEKVKVPLSDLSITIVATVSQSGPIAQKDLMTRLERDPMTLSSTIKKLKSQGYVKLSLGKEDRRVHLVHLTPKGTEVAKKIRAANTVAVKALAKEFPALSRM